MELAPDFPDRHDGPASERRQHAAAALYLCGCFGAMILYKAAIQHGEGPLYAALALAVAKALVLGRLILAVHGLRIGASLGDLPMIVVIACRSLLALAGLLATTFVEEAIAALVHGLSAAEALSRLAGGAGLEIAASAPLLLVLLPYFAFRELGDALGPSTLRRMLMGGAI